MKWGIYRRHADTKKVEWLTDSSGAKLRMSYKEASKCYDKNYNNVAKDPRTDKWYWVISSIKEVTDG